jgi:lysozyme
MTSAQCDAKFRDIMVEHEVGLLACAPQLRAAPDKTYIAINDFAYNVGVGAACGSTVIARVKAGDLAGACNALLAWIYVKKQVITGLVKRRVTGDATRQSGRDLCLAGLAVPR